MNVSGATSSPLPAAGSGNALAKIAELQKQISQVQKQIASETDSKDNAKTKLEVTQGLQLEEQELQIQIEQLEQQQAQAAQLSRPAQAIDAATPEASSRSNSAAESKLAATERSWSVFSAQA